MFKRISTAVLTLSMMGVASHANAATIAAQSFESSTSDTYNFTPNPGFYNTETSGSKLDPNGDEDVWDIIEEFTGEIDAAQDGTFFVGGQDLTNPQTNVDPHAIVFDTLDISSYTGVEVSFYYNAYELDTGDDLFYSVNGSQTKFFDGKSNLSSNGWEKVTVAIADSVTSLDFELQATQNGGSDFLGFDAVTVTGTVIPEPATGGLLLLGSVILMRRRLV